MRPGPTRRSALALIGAIAASTAVGLPPASAATIGVDGGAMADLFAFAVGTPGEWNWHVINAKSDADAILAWIEDQTGLTECEGEQRFLSADGDCLCDFCHAQREVEADRHPEWDGKPVVTGDATWFKSGMGACCSRCGYETYREEGGHAVDDKVVCEDCMTIADWEKVDPERARELREEEDAEENDA